MSHPASAASGARRSPWAAPLGVLLLALAVTGTTVAWLAHSIREKDRAAFEAEVLRTSDAIRERLDTTLTLLRGTAGLFVASEEVTAREFALYVGQLGLRERYPGILGIGFSERIDAAALPARVEQLRRSGTAGFRVWPEHPRDEYHSIVYLHPLDVRNRAAIGYDMYTEPIRRAAMARARDEGRAVASGKVELVQEIDEAKQAGFLIYVPLYRGGATPADVPARRRELLGYVYTPLRVDDLLQGARGSGAPLIDYELYDGRDATPQALLRSTRDARARPAEWTSGEEIHVAGRQWRLRFTSGPALEQRSQRHLVPWLALAAASTSVLLAWITWVQARARRAAEAAAAERRANELALQASEERARERAERLQQLYGELREGERRKDDFLAVLAHELRNPLAPIRNALEIIRMAPASPVAVRARDTADRQLRHMVRLVDDLLDVSRISRGKIVLRPERVPLGSLVQSAVETSAPLVEARRHQLHVDPVDPAVELEVDPARVVQVLTNLLNNAAKFTPEGGRIALGVEVDAQEVRIAVRDTGIGIAVDQLSHVFDMFVQLEHPHAGGGLGIGLHIARQLARMHGGRLEAHSNGAGQGAEFVLVLPCHAAWPAGATDAAA